ncbi:MAG TPA: AAA family ATPase [Burkholderiales bacterium]|nr:AAA family ATPase [Burkholderiales bacterium]
MIYLAHFGLREPPFSITPDTSFFCSCRSIQEALNTLCFAATNGEGFIKITGEVGTGKTLLCRKFLGALGPEWVPAYVPNPNLAPQTLLRAVADELGCVLYKDMDEHALMRAVNHRLLDLARENKRPILCIDESQAMSIETLEMVRLLTNLETEKRKLLQVVLFGQPELDEKLSRNEIRQLRQRITFEHRLSPLTREETAHYLTHRLIVAGYSGAGLFTRAATRVIHRASGGVPRLANIIAHKTLMLAFGRGVRSIGWREAVAAADDTPATIPMRRKPWAWVGVACAACAVALVGLVMKGYL